MKFYKIEGIIKDNTEEENEGGKYNKALQIRLKTHEFNRTHGDSLVCVERMKNGNITLGSICVDNVSVKERVKDFLTFIGLNAEIICMESTTMKTLFSLIAHAVLFSYLSDENSTYSN